jgi:hypothetical protein
LAGLSIVYVVSGIFSEHAEKPAAPDKPQKNLGYYTRLTLTPLLVAGDAPACQTEEALGPYAQAISQNDSATAQRYLSQGQCEVLGRGLKRDVTSIDIGLNVSGSTNS